jgi:hypothetical protein
MGRSGLDLGGITLPIDAVTETFWWLGIRGSGKTHDCSVFVEEMLDVRAQVIILDPMHAWYGLRSSASGTDTGYPIPIFGGARGDVPLEPGAGKYMAELAIGERVSMILDIKRWSKADRRRFVTAFLERLLEANDRSPVHVVLEEAPLFAPQRPQKEETTMLGVVEELVRLGRGEGIGCSLISQRSATINKEVSTQTEVLVAHRVRSPQDVDAVKAWFEVHDPDRSKEAARRLPHLNTGTAIVTSTSFLHVFEEVAFRPRRTFDSSRTPKVGETRREAKTLADVDLDVVKEAMADAIERAEATDPKFLARQLREAQERVRFLEGQPVKSVAVEVMVPEVPVTVMNEMGALRAECHNLGERIEKMYALAIKANEDGADRKALAREAEATVVKRERAVSQPPIRVPGFSIARDREETALTPYAEHLLKSLAARHPLPMTVRQWSVTADRSPTSSAWDPAVRQLRNAGYITTFDKGEWIATEKGLAVAGVDPGAQPPSGPELIEWWGSRITGPSAGAARRALQILYGHAPMTQDELADQAGWSRTSSGPGAAVGILVKLGLVERRDGLIHLDDQFIYG